MLSFSKIELLRAENHHAARLYERLGFEPIADPNATHILHLQPSCQPGQSTGNLPDKLK